MKIVKIVWRRVINRNKSESEDGMEEGGESEREDGIGEGGKS